MLLIRLSSDHILVENHTQHILFQSIVLHVNANVVTFSDMKIQQHLTGFKSKTQIYISPIRPLNALYIIALQLATVLVASNMMVGVNCWSILTINIYSVMHGYLKSCIIHRNHNTPLGLHLILQTEQETFVVME